MFYAIPLGLLVGWFRGGSLDQLGSSPFRRLPLLGAAFLLQLLLSRGSSWGLEVVGDLTFLAHLASYALLLGFLGSNLGAPGIPLTAAGSAGNLLVIAANGGMPVDVGRLESLGYGASAVMLRAGESATHVALTAGTRFPYLGDVILGPRWIPGSALLSPGDLLMMVGIAWVIAAGMVRRPDS